MLKRFEVENFKGFEKKLTLDLSARDYGFNPSIVRGGLVKNALVYGKNGSGKSSLGIALFDAVGHLTDKRPFGPGYVAAYRNLNSPEGKSASFRYVFRFDDGDVDYSYRKRSSSDLVSERLELGGKTVVDWEYAAGGRRFVDRGVAGSLKTDLPDNRLSVVKYLYRNLPTGSAPLLGRMVSFFERMLWYRSLSEGNAFAGYMSASESLTDRIRREGRLSDFRRFLAENGLEYDLAFKAVNGRQELFARFGSGRGARDAQFGAVASAGTMALLLYYYWSIAAFGDLSLLFIDEFDAFLHYESASSLVGRINAAPSFQSILTSHNTYLMNNRLTRPDCCFLIGGNRITALADATEKEIREAHNLEKMYVNGAFRE